MDPLIISKHEIIEIIEDSDDFQKEVKIEEHPIRIETRQDIEICEIIHNNIDPQSIFNGNERGVFALFAHTEKKRHNTLKHGIEVTDDNGPFQLEGKIEEHAIEMETKFTKPGSDSRTTIHYGQKSYQGSHRENQFSQDDQLVQHERIHTKEKLYKCSFCEKVFSKNEDLLNHLPMHLGEKRYECHQCLRKFAYQNNLVQHQRTHIGEKFNQCTICEKWFASKGAMIKHQQNVHPSVRLYQCSCCGKGFYSKGNLIKHQNMMHPTKNPYQCSHCEECFDSKGDLINHKNILHPAEKLYMCSFCEEFFATTRDLRKHEHSHTPKMPYQFSYGNKGLASKKAEVKRQNIHTVVRNSECSNCGKYFSKNGLAVHKSLHCEVKLLGFQCRLCCKKMSREDTLVQHYQKIHPGEKPYKCSHCEQGFGLKGALIKHKKIHTNGNP
ncbi:unnamed protein product [Meganyctiphanes norvegica]|uniref:C2H2-type domain-containing protein n=1 Tax=Meganyctiphanes norvegica TaxID=48144 RepID=A0AAV2QT60_MEGNR